MSTTIRLNADIRKAILTNAIKQTIWVKLTAALEERAAIAEEVRQLSFGGKLAEVKKMVKGIDDLVDAIKETSGKRVRFADGEITGHTVTANVDGMHIELPFSVKYYLCQHELKSSRINYRISDTIYKVSEATGYRERLVIKDEALKKRIMDNLELINKLEGESGAIIPTISAVLRKAQTVQKLIEMWPESEKYIPEDVVTVSKQVAGLPISIADLNSKIAALAA